MIIAVANKGGSRVTARVARTAQLAFMLAFCALLALGCASTPLSPASETDSSSESQYSDVGRARLNIKCIVPLSWDVDQAHLVGRQGSTHLWGTCGECVVANTVNLITGSAYTEADMVDFVEERGLCVPETGGMTHEDMATAYKVLLPSDSYDVKYLFEKDAPSIDEMAEMLEGGIILNVSVYGEMMREGGHTGEGSLEGTHWLVVHSVDRREDGSIAGFGIVDSASDMTYLSAQEFENIYHGHDGTTITDPTCIEVYGWRYADVR